MSLILSGTDGLSDVDGSASTPAIRGTDTNTGIFFPTANTVAASTDGTERMRITSGGVLELAQGKIKFPATQSASSDANTLDDYEEGTWTPIAARYTGGNITAVYGVSNAGKYTKIGRIVILECYLDITSVSSQGSSLSQVTGLPFTPSGSYAATGATFFNTAATTLNIVSCAANQGDNCIYFHESGNSGSLADFAWKAGAMTFTVIYIT